MDWGNEIPVVYENGVFRPEEPVDLPEHSRHRITLASSTKAATKSGNKAPLRDVLNALRGQNLIRLGGQPPTRDELHERS